MLLSQAHRTVPLVQQHAAVDASAHVPCLEVTVGGGLMDSNGFEHLGHGGEQGCTGRHHRHHLLQRAEVLEPVVALGHFLWLLCLLVVHDCLLPVELLGVIVTNLGRGLEHELIITTARLHKLHHLHPVALPLPQINGEVLPVNVTVDHLRLIDATKIHGNLCPLFHLIAKAVEALHVLDTLIITAPHKRLVSDAEVEGVHRGLGQQTPQPRVWVLLDVRVGVRQARGVDVLPHIPQTLGLEINHHVGGGLVGLLHDVVEHHRFDLELLERREVTA
mmetsp:Transcript_19431/g.40686  ORF Transcript_19431/g.40686 Transcript_19431/m.40686 type:complete len:276 (+) Transcript_19431:1144-1971(+)